ncbi:hypothetical protein NE237_030447 [Protea cynaroides]|uniref:Beta-fructofuranosidase n=1 Tax=Protea cynaroides TaxID=273540 RepID=A0A9Q0JWZ1_9MAGN|nr:hypothetical protein NE237_030447 [Protea cynaroides]
MTSSWETKPFTAVWFIGLCSLLLGCGIHVEASHRVFRHLQVHHNITATHQPYRTGYHFQPAKHWINEPMIYKGIYHLLYQYNPHGAVWGNIVWAHATSIDLVNWCRPHRIQDTTQHYERTIKPSIESDIKGRWSGSTTILPDGKPAILYTGIDPKKRQVQNLAFPKNLSDLYLRERIKVPQNPWASDGQWRVIIGSKIDRLGKAIIYKSKDFFKWERVDHLLHSSKNTGMWEFGLATSVIGPTVKHVLKDIYVPDEGSVDDDSGLRYDYGKFYASKTFFDSSKNRRILWRWINESDSVTDDVKKGWSGVQAIPRNIWLDKAGKQLVQWPVAEIEKLRKTPVELQGTQLNGGSVHEVTRVTASQVDVEVPFNLSTLEKAENLNLSGANPQILCSQKGASIKGSVGPFGLLALASKGLEEQTAIFFRVFKDKERFVVLMCSDQSRYMELNVLQIDHSIVESFDGKGKVCITSRVYPELAIFDKTRLYVFNNGTKNISISKLSAWSMDKATIVN